MSALSDIRDKPLGQWTPIEKCILETYDVNGLEHIAEAAAAQLSQAHEIILMLAGASNAEERNTVIGMAKEYVKEHEVTG